MNINILPECPITCMQINEPVITPDGNTYEKYAIEQWLLTHDTDPLSRNKLTVEQLIPNRMLGTLINNFNNILSIDNNLLNLYREQNIKLTKTINELNKNHSELLITSSNNFIELTNKLYEKNCLIKILTEQHSELNNTKQFIENYSIELNNIKQLVENYSSELNSTKQLIENYIKLTKNIESTNK